MYLSHQKIPKSQTGAVLVTSLVFMTILTVLAVATLRNNTADINMHKNMQSRTNALQCAEAAIRAGEIWLDDEVTSIPDALTTGIPDQTLNQVYDYSAPEIQDIFTKGLSWWKVNGWSYGSGLVDADHQVGCSEEPRYIVEKVGTVGDGSGNLEIAEVTKTGVDYFRITAFSVGVEDNTTVLLQTTFAKRLR